MKASVQSIGGELGIRFPPTVIEQGQLVAGSELEITVNGGTIVLTPLNRSPSLLDQLVGQITDDNMHDVVDWGPPVGGEVR